MAINDLLNGMKLTLAAAVVAAAGCAATPCGPPIRADQMAGGTTSSVQYAMSGTSRQAGESDDEYRRRMDEMNARQSGFIYTSGGVMTPNEDASRYAGVSRRDVGRYDDAYQHGTRPK